MIKLIFKSLWAHRGQNLWIMAELILISAVAFACITPVVVNKYFMSRNPGYDVNRLVRIELAQKPATEKYDSAQRIQDVVRVLSKVKSDPQVETATITSQFSFEENSLSGSSLPSDSVFGIYIDVNFIPGTDFFKTFGIKTVGGPDDGKVFNEPPFNKNDIVVSNSVAKLMHPGYNAVGHYLNEYSEQFTHDNDKMIVGVVNDAIYRSDLNRSAIVYKAVSLKKLEERNTGASSLAIVARMKPGVSPHDFIRTHAESINATFASGPVYAHTPLTFSEFRSVRATTANNNIFILSAIVVFLIINLCLGIIGTFYLQTRDRSRDAGIMRAFGGTRAGICRNMILEGWCMALMAWLISCAGIMLFFKDLIKIDTGDPALISTDIMRVIPLWTDDFTIRFAVISAIVLIIILMAVTIGIYIPARKIAKSSPVDALREIN